MDVTVDNFEEALALVKEHLPSASFVAFDLEFTGLGLDMSTQLDNPQRRYEMSRDVATVFPPCQFGMAIYRPAKPLSEIFPEQDRVAMWECLPFNFNLCPRAVYQNSSKQFPMRDFVFSIQASSAEFLYYNHFDFNKMFGKSVSWLRKDHEESIRAEILVDAKPAKQRSAQRIQFKELSERDQKFVMQLADEMQKLFGPQGPEPPGFKATPVPTAAGENAVDPPAVAASDDENAKGVVEEGKILVWDKHENSMVRRYIYDMLEDDYPWLTAHYVRHHGGVFFLRLQAMPSAKLAREANDAHRVKETNDAIDRRMRGSVGFRFVIDALREARVPVIAHNALHDVCKTYANFIGPLPRQLAQFKTALHDNLPLVIDTKVILEHCVRTVPWIAAIMKEKKYDGQSALENLSERIDEKCAGKGLARPQIRFYTNANDFHDHLNIRFRRFDGVNPGTFRHQADYDAFATGKVFIQLTAVLAGERYDPRDEGHGTIMDRLCSHAAVAPFVNRVAIPSCGGYSSFNFGAEDPGADEENEYLDRDDVLVLRNYSEYAKKKDLKGPIGHGEIFRYTEELFAGNVFHATRANRRILHDEGGLLVVLEPRPQPTASCPVVAETCCEQIVEESLAETESNEIKEKDSSEIMVLDATPAPMVAETRCEVAAEVMSADADSHVDESERSTEGKKGKPVRMTGAGEAPPPLSGSKRKLENGDGRSAFAPPRVVLSVEERAKGISDLRLKATEMGLSMSTYREALGFPTKKRRRRDINDDLVIRDREI